MDSGAETKDSIVTRNEAVVRAFLKGWEDQDLDAVMAQTTLDIVYLNQPLPPIVGRENVIAGTDCGFAQGPFHRRVHPSIMWAKLEALVQGARLASKELWS